MANKERRVVSHSWILGRKHTTTTKNYPLLRTPQHWMPGNGWRGWSRGVDAHEAAGGKRLVSAQGLESRRRERWGRRWSHKESKHPLTAEQQTPTSSWVAPRAVPRHLHHTVFEKFCSCPSPSSQRALYPLRRLGMMDLGDI